MKRPTFEEARAWQERSARAYQERRRANARAPRESRPRVTSQRQRRRADEAVYQAERDKRMVRARYQCEYADGYVVRCEAPATDCHHIVRRSNDGGRDDHRVHNVENLRVLCHYHHIDVIHANVGWAKENGWIKASWPQLGESDESGLTPSRPVVMSDTSEGCAK